MHRRGDDGITYAVIVVAVERQLVTEVALSGGINLCARCGNETGIGQRGCCSVICGADCGRRRAVLVVDGNGVEGAAARITAREDAVVDGQVVAVAPALQAAGIVAAVGHRAAEYGVLDFQIGR